MLLFHKDDLNGLTIYVTHTHNIYIRGGTKSLMNFEKK